jgi:translocation and assembly module TamB
MNIPSGRAAVHAAFSRSGKGRPLHFALAVRLREAAVKFKPIRSPVREVDGTVNVLGGVISMRLKGRLESTPFLISGYVLNPADPRLAFNVTSDSADLRQLAELLCGAKRLKRATLPRDGRVRAWVFGRPRSPGVSFTVEARSAKLGALDSRSIEARGVYFNRRLTIQEASALVYGGRMRVRGEVDLSGKPQAVLRGRVADIALSRLPGVRKEGFDAVGSGSFRALWADGKPDVRWQGSMSGRVSDIAFTGGEIDLRYADGVFQVRDFSADTLGGQVSAVGKIKDGVLDLSVAGADINLARVAGDRWEAPIVGRGHFLGRLTGKADSPTFEGEVGAHRVMVSGLGIQRIAGRVTADRKSVNLHDLVLYDYPGTVRLSGNIEVPLSLRSRVDMTAGLDSLAGALRLPGLTEGSLSGDVKISGQVRNPRAEGRLALQGGSYKGMPLDSLQAGIVYHDRELQIKDFTARSGDSTLIADGRVSRERTAVKFNGENLPLDKFSDLLSPYACLAGKVAVSGTISGRARSPDFRVEAKSEDLTINGRQFTRLAGKAEWRRTALRISDLTLSDGAGTYTIADAFYDSAAKQADLDVQIKGGSASLLLALADSSPFARQASDGSQRLRSLLKNIPRPLAGVVDDAKVSGSIDLAGKRVIPDLHIEGAVTDLSYGSSSIKTLTLKGAWEDSLARLDEFEAADGDTRLSAEGSFGPADSIVLRLDARSLSVEALRHWVKLPHNFSGKADVTIVAGGSRFAPTMETHLDIAGPVIAGVKCDRLHARLSSSGESSAGTLSVDELALSLGGREISARGRLPMNWKRLTVQKDQPVFLESALSSDSVELLSAFFGMPAETAPGGIFEGSVRLGGTVQTPSLEGELTWSDGIVRPPRLSNALEKIDARLELKDERISIEKLTGQSSQGGSFDATGEIKLANLKPTLDIRARTNRLTIAGRNISNSFGEEVRAALDANVSITGDWRSPTISGDLSIPEGSIELAGKPDEAGEPVKWRFAPVFDVKVALGRDVEIRTPRLSTPLQGNISIAGELSKPVINGLLGISSGTIFYPTREFRMREFKILPGSTMTLQMRPAQGPLVFIDMQAVTKLTAASLSGKRKRYTVTMIAKGPLDKLDPTFASSPPGLSEQTIVALITGQPQLEQLLVPGSRDFGRELSGLFSTAVMPTVFEPIEQAFQEALGFGEFALEVGYHEPLQMTIGNRLLDQLYVDYTAFVGSRPDYADSLYELRLAYRFKPSLELGVLTDENRVFRLTLEGKTRF